LCGRGATDVVLPEGTDASSEMSGGKSHSAYTSIIQGVSKRALQL